MDMFCGGWHEKAVTLKNTKKTEPGVLETDFDMSFCSLGKGNRTIHCDVLNNLEQYAREQ